MRKIFRKPILSAETGGKGCQKSCDVRKHAENIGEPRKKLLHDTESYYLLQLYLLTIGSLYCNTVVPSYSTETVSTYYRKKSLKTHLWPKRRRTRRLSQFSSSQPSITLPVTYFVDYD